MDHLFDEFSKSLAESVPRRESLRRLGAVFAGAVLSPLGVGTAWAGRRDPCKAFCKCGTTKQQSQCLAACRACNGNTGRIGGSCGKYVCCSTASCGGVCSDLLHDPNCGACGNNCHALGKTCCGGRCVDLATDFYNCGSCGSCVCRTSSQRNRRVRLRHVRLPLRRWRHPLQRHLHLPGFRSRQLRSLRQRLWRINAVLYQRDMHGNVLQRRRLELGQQQLRRVRHVCPEQTACSFGTCEGYCDNC